MSEAKKDFMGSCLCGNISYQVKGELRPVILCHCTQCRKTSGHHVAATSCQTDTLTIEGDSLNWYQSSDYAKRGFCQICGSNLFWRPAQGSKTAIFAGTLDGDTGLKVEAQIYTENKGDYYALPRVPVIKQSQIGEKY